MCRGNWSSPRVQYRVRFIHRVHRGQALRPSGKSTTSACQVNDVDTRGGGGGWSRLWQWTSGATDEDGGGGRGVGKCASASTRVRLGLLTRSRRVAWHGAVPRGPGVYSRARSRCSSSVSGRRSRRYAAMVAREPPGRRCGSTDASRRDPFARGCCATRVRRRRGHSPWCGIRKRMRLSLCRGDHLPLPPLGGCGEHCGICLWQRDWRVARRGMHMLWTPFRLSIAAPGAPAHQPPVGNHCRSMGTYRPVVQLVLVINHAQGTRADSRKRGSRVSTVVQHENWRGWLPAVVVGARWVGQTRKDDGSAPSVWREREGEEGGR